jgi:hypothetical protein
MRLAVQVLTQQPKSIGVVSAVAFNGDGAQPSWLP